jgi:endoglucanase
MIRSLPTSRCSLLLPAFGLLVGAVACAAPDTTADTAEVAVSGGGVTVDVVTTNAWNTGFNGAVRITNSAFPSPITSFEVVFRLGGSASIVGPSWNGDISAPDGTGARTATQPSWLPSSPITVGRTWEVGFPGAGTFVSSTVVSVRINGQAIPLGGGGGGGDTAAPTVTLSSSSTSVTTAGTITLTASATDNVGVARVEFRDGNNLLSTDTSAPYLASVGLTSAHNGTHVYTARAIDAAGNAGTSAPVTVTVNISGGGGGGGTGYTTAGGKLFKDGVEIKLWGLNWFGLETPDRVLHGLWTGRALADFLADIKSKGFNALRLPLSPQTINPGFPISDAGPGNGEDFTALNGRDGRTALEYTLGKAQAAGVFVLLDFHTCDPARLGSGLPGSPIACSGYGVERWLADMRTLATLSRTYTNVVGIDLTNEPHSLTWSAWANLASQAGQAILAINPAITIWVEGVGNVSPNGGFDANWGGNLFEAAAIPGIPANRLVFSPHAYGPSVAVLSYFSDPSYPANMPRIWDTLFGHLVGKGFTVVTGEFGGRYTTSSNPGLNDKLWQDSFVTYLLNKGITSNFYWAVNPNSGDTGGVFGDDWRTWNNDKLLLLQRLMR